MALQVRVIAPDKTVWDDAAEEVILPSTTGQLGILTNHAPLLTALDVGVMRLRANQDWLAIALLGGFAEVENNTVTVLVNGAERGDRIDREATQAALTTAEAELAAVKEEDRSSKMQAEQTVKRLRALLQAAGGVTPASL
mgnify:CR=1 FL=1